MSPERHQRAGQLYHTALEVKPEARVAFLDEACGSDDELRREVESLLAAHDNVGNYFAAPAIEVAAGLVAKQHNPSLLGRSISHYRLLSFLGAGGMGEVYLAEDNRLGRKVALKILPAAYTQNQERVRRFEQEARAASALNHPNILTIYEVGQEDGRHFIAVEYIEGDTLRELLTRGQMEFREAVEVGAQIASALAAAHEAGIVHRDIKPENLMVRRDGLVKVLDFGLAKLTATERVMLDTEKPTAPQIRTQTGLVMGTVNYMSPEQARGQKVDARTDIFSLGVVLYEMVGGRRPFEGDTASDVIAALLTAEPPPLKQPSSNATAELERITRRCLAKNREARYQSAKELTAELKTLQTGSEVKEPAATRNTQALGARLGPWRWRVAAAIGALLIVGLAWFLVSRRVAPLASAEQIKSLAVLPLDNLSGDPSQDYLADGMTEALITELSKIGSLRVTSRKSVMQYKTALKPLPEIARELNVDVIVSGSVQRSGDKLGITAHLIRGITDQQIWANQYERDLRDVLSLQREIARAIAGEINVKLTPKEQGLLANARPINPQAHEAYLNGLYWLNKGIDESRTEDIEPFQKSLYHFEQALKFDPDYALAYSGLSHSYQFLSTSGFPQYYPRSKEAALKALSLDQNLAGAHGALAYTIWRHEWNFGEAENEFKKAVELAPGASHWGYAQFLSTLGRHDEALLLFRLAQDADPLTVSLKISVGWAFIDARQYDQAIAQFRTVFALDPKRFETHSGLCVAYTLKGMYDAGIAECQKALEVSGDRVESNNLAWAYATAGRRIDAIKILDELKDPSKRESVEHMNVARIYSALGEKDLGMKQLEMGYSKRQELLWLKVDPTFDGLRSDPRFTDLLRRIGFPE